MPGARPHRTTNMSTLALKVPPPIAAAILAAAMWLISSATVALAMPATVRISLVVLFAIAGAGFSLAGAIAFRRAKTTVNPMKPENASSLVVSGVYRISCDYRGHRPTVAPRHSDGTGRGACIYPSHALRVLGINGLCTDRRHSRWHGIDACLPSRALCHLVSRDPCWIPFAVTMANSKQSPQPHKPQPRPP